MEESSGKLYVRDRGESEDDPNNDRNGSPTKSSSLSSLRSLRDTFKRSESRTSQSSTVEPSTSTGITKLNIVEVERNNLLNLCKSIVRELLQESVTKNGSVDSDSVTLRHFFVIMEHILRHGLKVKKGILGPRKDTWDILQCIETYCPEAEDITRNVRELSNVKTSNGRTRAWLRFALMKKKLSDYWMVLIQHKNKIMGDFYEPHAFIMTEKVNSEQTDSLMRSILINFLYFSGIYSRRRFERRQLNRL